MSKITCKPDVRLKAITPGLGWILYALELFVRHCPYAPDEVVITSINDGAHGADSRHYLDEAIDIRSRNFKVEVREKFRQELEGYLNANPVALAKNDGHLFRVLIETIATPGASAEHFHVQVTKGKFYP